MTPTLPALYAILLQAVKDMTYRPGRIVNAFALVDGMPDLSHASFGYGWEDFQAGRFWSRAWVDGGASPATVVGDYPVLMPELISSRRTGTRTLTHQVDVTMIDRLEGLDQEGCRRLRAGAEVYAGLLEMALALVDEVKGYSLYDTDYGPVWAAPERMKTDVRWFGADDLDQQLGDDLTGPEDLRPWGDYPALRGLYFTLTLTECIDTGGVAFRYDRTEAEAVGVISCAGTCY